MLQRSKVREKLGIATESGCEELCHEASVKQDNSGGAQAIGVRGALRYGNKRRPGEVGL